MKAAAQENGEDSIASKRKLEEDSDDSNTASDMKIQKTDDKPVEQVNKTAIEA